MKKGACRDLRKQTQLISTAEICGEYFFKSTINPIECWNKIQIAITKFSEEVIEIRTRENNRKWISDNSWKIIEGRKRTKGMLNKTTKMMAKMIQR